MRALAGRSERFGCRDELDRDRPGFLCGAAVVRHRRKRDFAYEWDDEAGTWFRSYGNENWEFGMDGLMHRRIASINDLPIEEAERHFRWPAGPRPAGHPGLFELGL